MVSVSELSIGGVSDGPSVRRLKDAQRLGLVCRFSTGPWNETQDASLSLGRSEERGTVIADRSPMLRPDISRPRRAGTCTRGRIPLANHTDRAVWVVVAVCPFYHPRLRKRPNGIWRSSHRHSGLSAPAQSGNRDGRNRTYVSASQTQRDAILLHPVSIFKGRGQVLGSTRENPQARVPEV